LKKNISNLGLLPSFVNSQSVGLTVGVTCFLSWLFRNLQGVSGEIVNILVDGSMDYSE